MSQKCVRRTLGGRTREELIPPHVACYFRSHTNRSIFAPRRKEAESRAFFDTERVVRKAFDVDYARTLKEERVLKLIAKSDPAVVKGSKTVKESLEEASMLSSATRCSFCA